MLACAATRGQGPRLLLAVIRSKATLAFAAEDREGGRRVQEAKGHRRSRLMGNQGKVPCQPAFQGLRSDERNLTIAGDGVRAIGVVNSRRCRQVHRIPRGYASSGGLGTGGAGGSVDCRTGPRTRRQYPRLRIGIGDNEAGLVFPSGRQSGLARGDTLPDGRQIVCA